jgi:SAM-dependent methyltransferase
MRTLEIGCGTGMFTGMFARTGTQIVAVDISCDLLAKAREKGLPADRVLFLEKRFEECELDGPFDAVVGSSVLHHLEIGNPSPDPRPAEARRRDVFAEPNLLNPQVFIERKFTFLRPWRLRVSGRNRFRPLANRRGVAALASTRWRSPLSTGSIPRRRSDSSGQCRLWALPGEDAGPPGVLRIGAHPLPAPALTPSSPGFTARANAIDSSTG